jgi:hypothetical protein
MALVIKPDITVSIKEFRETGHASRAKPEYRVSVAKQLFRPTQRRFLTDLPCLVVAARKQPTQEWRPI